jgi:hypothetical protein
MSVVTAKMSEGVTSATDAFLAMREKEERGIRPGIYGSRQPNSWSLIRALAIVGIKI